MKQQLSVEIVQAAPLPGAVDDNVRRVIELVHGSSAEVVLLPELFLTGYTFTNVAELALPRADARLAAIADVCRAAGRGTVFGYIEGDGERVFNSMLVIDEHGRQVASVRKTHLFGGEAEAFSAGDQLQPVEIGGLRAGIVNCFELEFPEVSRTLALRGAEVILAGSANMHPYYEVHLLACRARAFENAPPLAYSNRCGAESGFDFCGGSRAVAADGSVLAQLADSGEDSVVVELECVDRSAHPSAQIGQRRPELYAQ